MAIFDTFYHGRPFLLQNHTRKNVSNGIIYKSHFLTFPADFWIPIIFSNFNYNCSNILDLRNLQEQVKKAFSFKNWSDLSLFEWIVLVISKNLQILGLQPQKFFSITRTICYHSRSKQFWKQNTISETMG
jgi:hypothetical protein